MDLLLDEMHDAARETLRLHSQGVFTLHDADVSVFEGVGSIECTLYEVLADGAPVPPYSADALHGPFIVLRAYKGADGLSRRMATRSGVAGPVRGSPREMMCQSIERCLVEISEATVAQKNAAMCRGSFVITDDAIPK